MSIRRTVSAGEAEWSIARAPAWYAAREVDWRYRPPADEAVAWLLVDEQHHVASQARSRRWVRQLLSLSAVQSLAQVEIEFDPAADRVVLHELVVWRQGADGAWQRGAAVPVESFLLRQREQQLEQQVLHGRVTLMTALEDVRVGDVVDLHWTIEPRERMTGLAFTTYFAFAWGAPVAHARVTLHRDPGVPLRWRLHPGGDGAPPVEHAQDGVVTWSLDAVPRFAGEDNVPGDHWHWPLLEATAWASWAEVAGFVAGLWQDAFIEDAAAIASEAARLLHECAGDSTRAVLHAIRFVQEDVRYLAIDFGHGAGMMPNGAGTVLKRRFGDCKDKTVLLTALLRALGVNAWPVLVAAQWRDAVERLMPSPSAFGHVIVAFDHGGQRCFVDPTLIGQRGDLDHRVSPPYRAGLLLDAATTALCAIPLPHEGALRLTETFELDRRGKGHVAQRLEASGQLADDLRAHLLQEGPAAFARTRAEALRQRFPALVPNVDETTFDDDTQRNVLTMTATYALPTWGPAGQKPPPIFDYGAYGLLLGLDTIDARAERRQPWALRHPLQLDHRVIVRGQSVHRARPSHFSHQGPGFHYRCDVASRRRETSFVYTWETTADRVAAADWPAYVRERDIALGQTGALVITRGMTFGRGTRIVFGIALAVSLGWRLAHQPDRPGPPAIDRVAAERAASTAFDDARRGDFAAAYGRLEPAMRYYDGQFDVQNLWAEAAMRTGHYDVAARAIAAARAIKPDHHLPRQMEASLDELKGDFTAARRILDELAQRPDIDVRVLVDRARVTERAGDQAAARTAWEQVLARQPGQPDALFAYASLLWAGGDRVRADDVMENTLRAQPTPSAVLETVAQRYYGTTGRHTRALASARRAAELSPREALAQRGLVMALLNAGEAREAVQTAEAMTHTFEDNPLAWGAFATAAAVTKQYDAARPAFDRWVQLAPDDPDAHSSQGYFLHVVGDDAHARDVLGAAVQRFPSHGTLWLNYAVVLEALGDAGAPAARSKAETLMTPEQRANLVR